MAPSAAWASPFFWIKFQKFLRLFFQLHQKDVP
jgi:hypothetical protein